MRPGGRGRESRHAVAALLLLAAASLASPLFAQRPALRREPRQERRATIPPIDAMTRSGRARSSETRSPASRGGTRTVGGGGPVQCEKCHADRQFLVGKTRNERGDSVLFVPDTLLRDSRHRTLVCADCHAGYNDGYPHASVKAVAVPCQDCHADQGDAWHRSMHAVNFERKGDAATCVNCHSSHRVLGVDDPRSPTFPLNVARLCGSCHNSRRILDAYFKKPADTTGRTAVGDYKSSVHGLTMTRSGLVLSANCSDCHDAHRVLPPDSTSSTLSRPNVAATCGACHVGVKTTYDSSAHGTALAKGDTTESGHQAPVCIDCHGGHTVVEASDPVWFRGVVKECGACHARLLATYDETYHGQATQVGGVLAARCSDCHTPHSMLPAKDPQSSVHPNNLVETCRQCHATANANFVKFRVHADVRDRAKYPGFYWVWRIMTTILVGTFVVFGIHSLLFFVRLRMDRHKAHGHGDEPGMDDAPPPATVPPLDDPPAPPAAPDSKETP